MEVESNNQIANNRTELLKVQKAREEINNALDKTLILTNKATELGGNLVQIYLYNLVIKSK